MKRVRISAVAIAALATLTIVACATFKGEISVDLDLPETVYISPMNQDGIQDQLVVPLAFPEIKNLAIQGYRFSVIEAVGTEDETIVYTIEEVADKRAQRKGVTIPDELVWTGVYQDGEYVPDGEYLYRIEAWDRFDNTGTSPFRYVVVDNTPPSVEVFSAHLLFSPNGDGINDLLQISQRRSAVEDSWVGEIRDSQGVILREFDWALIATDFVWDGKDSSGKVVADGTYGYAVRSTDLAGNAATVGLDGIVVDTKAKQVTLAVDSTVFSPNGDGRKDTVRFSPTVLVARDLDRWTLEIANARGEIVRRFTGTGAPWPSVEFDGKNDAGTVLPDGQYRGVLTVIYTTGEKPTIASPPVLLDNTKPLVTLSADFTLFSPDGDGNKDKITISQSSSAEDLWEGAILDSNGQTVIAYTWQGRAVQFSWDAKDGTGRQVPDGTYSYRINATDAAQNRAVAELKNIRIDTRPTPITVRVSAASFSPNSDGFGDFLSFSFSASIPDGLSVWTLSILGADKSIRKTTSGGTMTGLVPDNLTWDGRTEEGSFTAVFTAEYQKGNVTSVSTAPFLVDVTGPQASLSVTPKPFSPDGDGEDDTLSIAVSLKDASPIDDWSIQIFDPTGKPFKAVSGKGAPTSPILWNGRSDNGELVQSAYDYTLVFKVRDTMRNLTKIQETIPVDILVLRDGDRLKIIISSIYFKPFTADYTSVDADQAKRNLATLDRLAVILKKYSGYKIRIEGHAVRIYWFDPQRLKEEEAQVLLPLSKERADVIKQALVKRGIAEARITTQGFGGTQPVVPHSDLDNRWKNRRVEFILIKE
ncbi:MAG: gliding motility-associated C-terminal domain-containing protein [Spirochaetaceae bacterium]|nr:MAG: gliding motility-associated C-terminal domain-containing protein [Spirochaetaceae bacterium]